MKTVRVSLVGSGFAASLHAESYRRVCGVEVRLHAVASLDPDLPAFAARHGFERAVADYRDLLADPEVDVVDLCTPPVLHAPMVAEAMRAGKHVICEKPLSGFFGAAGDESPVGRTVPKQVMYDEVVRTLDALRRVVETSGRRFFYAENYVYAPSVAKCGEILSATAAKILYMKGEESHNGSHARHAPHWRLNGGGSLIRLGSHPLSALLYLKGIEAACRGERIGVRSVVADTGVATDCLSPDEKRFLDCRPVDVEDTATLVLTFSDGTKASLVANDIALGGVRNSVEVFTNVGTHLCRISPNDAMSVYAAEEKGLEDVYLTEKSGTRTGWQNVFLDEAVARGYVGELQDFLECIVEDREPKSGFALADETLRVLYGAYVSAEEGIRFDFAPWAAPRA